LVTLVYGSGFAGSGPLLGFLGLNLLAGSIEAVAGNGLWAVDRPRANLPADITNFTVAAVIGTVLVIATGSWGVAIGLGLGATAGATVRFYTLVRVLRSIEPAASVIPIKSVE